MAEFLNEERIERVTICGCEFALMLSVGAMRSINERFGGLSNLGRMLSEGDDVSDAVESVVWLFCLLANQTILCERARTGTSRTTWDARELEVMMTPADLRAAETAIMGAIRKGTDSTLAAKN